MAKHFEGEMAKATNQVYRLQEDTLVNRNTRLKCLLWILLTRRSLPGRASSNHRKFQTRLLCSEY